jgi:hypothetical protein
MDSNQGEVVYYAFQGRPFNTGAADDGYLCKVIHQLPPDERLVYKLFVVDAVTLEPYLIPSGGAARGRDGEIICWRGDSVPDAWTPFFPDLMVDRGL